MAVEYSGLVSDDLVSLRLDKVAGWELTPYKNVAIATIEVPNRKQGLPSSSRSCKIMFDTKQDIIIDIDVAKPFKMLSAYLMTAATRRPPNA